LTVGISLSQGAVALSFAQLWQALLHQGDPINQTILWDLRLPRTMAALIVGAALGMSVPCYRECCEMDWQIRFYWGFLRVRVWWLWVGDFGAVSSLVAIGGLGGCHPDDGVRVFSLPAQVLVFRWNG
jgi:hypothetical protein